MKIFHFCAMMKSLGHTVFHYGVEGSNPECDEHVQILSKNEQESYFGKYNPDALYEVDWSGNAEYWKLMNARASAAIKRRCKPGDFLCIMNGTIGKPVADALPELMAVEYGIGYNGTFTKYRVFESYSHMHKIWGAQGGYDPDGHLYDAVIPNYLNPDDYPLQLKKGDYYLYLGRLIRRKGIHIAVETCKNLGVKLKLAGQGCTKVEGNKIFCADGAVYEGDNLEYVGFATGNKRAELYQNAIGTFISTIYIEPFGAVAVESQMAGTPAITTDFGAFTETVEHGRTGFRCHTLNEFCHAARNVPLLDRQYTHDRAVKLYSMENVKWQYQTYFERLQDLYGKGWYELHDKPDEHWLRGYQ
jgi:glycosyltransferase involved in cell wall biosynthesis